MFKLAKLTDYAVVVLAGMAREQTNPVPVSAIAESTAIPEPTVSKVLKMLSKAGVVNSVRGASGGYALRYAAHKITVLDIVVAIEGPFSVVACVEDSTEDCALQGHCMMYGRWGLVNDAMKEALGRVTLQDMLSGQDGHSKPVHQIDNEFRQDIEERVQ